MMSKCKIEITEEEYDDLINDQKFLYALQAAGVDSWEGYEQAREIMGDGEG